MSEKLFVLSIEYESDELFELGFSSNNLSFFIYLFSIKLILKFYLKILIKFYFLNQSNIQLIIKKFFLYIKYLKIIELEI